MVKNPPAGGGTTGDIIPSLGWEDPLEKEMATPSNIRAWEIPRTEEPGGLQSVGCKELNTSEHTRTFYLTQKQK